MGEGSDVGDEKARWARKRTPHMTAGARSRYGQAKVELRRRRAYVRRRQYRPIVFVTPSLLFYPTLDLIRSRSIPHSTALKYANTSLSLTLKMGISKARLTTLESWHKPPELHPIRETPICSLKPRPALQHDL